MASSWRLASRDIDIIYTSEMKLEIANEEGIDVDVANAQEAAFEEYEEYARRGAEGNEAGRGRRTRPDSDDKRADFREMRRARQVALLLGDLSRFFPEAEVLEIRRGHR
jgi:hypothetical protein